MKYAIVIEKGPRHYGAYVPDLPGCIATDKTPALVKRRIARAIEAHIAMLRESGQPVPEPTSIADYASVA